MSPQKELQHGTPYGYERGCRCEECSAAQFAARRAWRAQARAAQSESYLRELAAARERKERYRGACEVCGAPTNGSNGPGTAPKRCIHHPRPRRLLPQGPTIEKILAFIGDSERRYSEIVDGCGITNNTASTQLNRLLRYGMVERVGRGVYRKGGGA